MVLIGFLLTIGFLLSQNVTRRVLPFESLIAFVVLGTTCVVLFQIGRLS